MPSYPPHSGHSVSSLRDSLNAQFETQSRPPEQAASVKLDPPDLSDLGVTVPEIPLPGQLRLAEVFAHLQRLASPVTARRMGKEVQDNDEVLVDLLVWTAGQVVPLSPRSQQWLTPGDDGGVPGLQEALTNWKVGTGDTLNTILEESPLQSQRGEPAVVSVVIHAAQGRQLLPPDSPELLQKLNMGADLDAVFKMVAEQVRAENERDQHRKIQRAVLDALVERSEARIPQSAVDAELNARWARTDGAVLTTLQIQVSDKKAAQERMLNDPQLRTHAEKSIHAAALLAAIARRDDVKAGPDDVGDFLVALSSTSGKSASELLDAMTEGANISDALVKQLLYLKTIDHVVAQAEVKIEAY